MNYDIYSEYGLQTRENLGNIEKSANLNIYTKLKVSSVFLGTDLQEIAKAQYRSIVNFKSGNLATYSEKIIIPALNTIHQSGILKPEFTIPNRLPLWSYLIQFTFTLAKAYLSKDDEEFYICDNPVRKDKVFKVPMVSGSSWKGNMRWTALKNYVDDLPVSISDTAELEKWLKRRTHLVRLFGHEKEVINKYLNLILAKKRHGELIDDDNTKEISDRFDEFLMKEGYISSGIDGRRGRLNFYPTFFDKIGLEVINPHDRNKKVGTAPIYIESVPEGAMGIFSLLYVPFDLLGRATHIAKEEVSEDMTCTYNALKEMMITYGFSAKKSSGFGVIEDNFKSDTTSGHFLINGISLSNNQFDNFSGLATIIEEVKSKL